MRHQVTKDGQGANIYWKEYQWGIDYRLYNIIDHTYKDRDVGNVSDVLLKSQQLINQYNTKELPCYFSLYTIEISVF